MTKKRKVLVTGSSGFIGSHVMNHFLNKDFNVVGCDIYIRNNANEKQIDLTDESEIYKLLKQENPDIIIHCAGNANVNTSVKDPDMDYRSNVVVTKNLLNSLNKINIKPRIVFLSSAAVYGNQEKLPIKEDNSLNPLSPYASNKKLCEEMCCLFNRDYGFDIKIARIFSVYGNGLKKQIFWDMYQKYIKTGKLEMFGTGKETRDYIHINDLLEVIFLLATVDSKHEIFNVANGEETKISEVANMFAEINGITEVSFNGITMVGNPLNWKADISRIKEIGYMQSIGLYNGITEYSNWVKNN